jgi:hypothetical protein
MTTHHNGAFMKTIIQFLSGSLLVVPAVVSAAEIQQGEMGGYLFGPAEKVPEEFNGGFSLYAAAWRQTSGGSPTAPATARALGRNRAVNMASRNSARGCCFRSTD